MVGILLIGPKFRSFSAHNFTHSLQDFRVMSLVGCLNPPDSALFQHFLGLCETLDDHLCHHVPRSRDLLLTFYATQKYCRHSLSRHKPRRPLHECHILF
jgi:hypothetical protein